MPAANITATFVAQVAKPAKGRVYWMDETLPGFALCVSCTGSKVFYWIGRGPCGPTRTKIENAKKITVSKARDLCVQVHADVLVGRPPRTRLRTTSMTVGQVWEWHLTHNLKPNNKTWPKDVRTYNFAVKQWGELPIEQLTRTMIVEKKTATLERKSDASVPGGITGGPGAVNKFLSVLRGICRTAVAEGWATKNPAQQVKKCRIPKRVRFIDEDEIATFFTHLDKLKVDRKDYFLIALFTGARRSNVSAMAWKDINFRRATWVIPSEESKNKEPINLPLSSVVMTILERRKKASTSPWVFPGNGPDGHYVDPSKQWKKLLKDSGIKDLRVHDLRRTLGSWQAIAGESLQTIRDSLGQTSYSAALIYARLNDRTVRDSVQSTADAITLTVNAKKIETLQK